MTPHQLDFEQLTGPSPAQAMYDAVFPAVINKVHGPRQSPRRRWAFLPGSKPRPYGLDFTTDGKCDFSNMERAWNRRLVPDVDDPRRAAYWMRQHHLHRCRPCREQLRVLHARALAGVGTDSRRAP